MSKRNPLLRSGITLAALLGLVVVAGALRLVQANGVFSSVTPGFSGTCTALPVAGVSDIEIDAADHLAFLAVMDGRNPGPRDGIYALDLSGPAKLARLPGTPADFHPRGIGLFRTANGGLFLAAVNHRSNGASARAGATTNMSRFSIDTFEITRKAGTASLTALGTIQGGLLGDPQDVAMAGPNSFYASNGITAKNGPMRVLQSYGVTAGGDIVYFNGTMLREVVKGLSGPRGLVLTGDGDNVLVGDATGRELVALSREPFTGNLSEAGSLALPAGADRLALEGNTLWVAGHANLFTWRDSGRDPGRRAPSQIFRVTLAHGVPQSAEQVYANGGSEIAGAGIGAASGNRLLIGSPLDGKLLDCRLH